MMGDEGEVICMDGSRALIERARAHREGREAISAPRQMNPAPPPDERPRSGVYMELMKKHDSLNPRIK